jgi:hypothetical protein
LTGHAPALWLVPICMTVHNAEEALGAARFLADLRALFPWARLARTRVFVAALVLLTAATWAVAGLAAHDRGDLWPAVLLGLQVALAANAFVPHLMLLAVLRRYSPGLLTAALLNLPIGAVLLLGVGR